MAPLPPLTPSPPESPGARVAVRTRSEVSDEAIRQSDAALVFVKLRKMIASDTQSTDTILGTIAVAAHSLTGASGAAIAMPLDGAVVCVGRSGETAPDLGERLNVDSGISGECLRTGVIQRCDDASRDFHVDAEVCRQLGLQSIAVVPLRGQHGRVGVLEAFSGESYAFTEDKMELLGRLAGLAEAAWARGAVTDLPAAETDLVITNLARDDEDIDEVPVAVEAPPEPPASIEDAVPLAQVREVFSSPEYLTAQRQESRARIKWRLAALAAVAVLGLALLSVYGWRAWYQASVASGRKAASPQSALPVNENATAGTGFSGTPDVVRPAARPRALSHAHAAGTAATAEVADQVIRRQPRAAQPVDHGRASTGTVSEAASISEDIPLLAASSTAPSDLSKAIEKEPALPQLTVPVSQGTSGGVLVHKVQPVYPPEARRLHRSGRVVIEGVVNGQGQVDDLKLVSGDPLLSAAAMDAVRKWRYSPYLLNGKPFPKQTKITISFIAP